MRELREVAGANPAYPPILFVHQGTVEDAQTFFKAFWPAVRGIADPDRQLYRAFGIKRGSLRELASPDVIACAVRARAHGNRGGKPVGDPRLMPGLFLVAGDRILWQHRYRHFGDQPDFAALGASRE
ncbi:MAG: AhpC/TSA family protein [Thermomicrobiales bacterium]